MMNNKIQVVLCVIIISLYFVAAAWKKPLSPKYVITPGGNLVWSDCMYEAPDESTVVDTEGVTTVIHPDGTEFTMEKCKYPIQRAHTKKSVGAHSIHSNVGAAPTDGWQVWSTFQHPNNDTFVSFYGLFNVPGTPTTWDPTDQAILYMFTGLQSDNWVPINNEPPAPSNFDIIQPVIQFGGGSENGGGQYWGIASWYVTLNDGAVWSKLLDLNAGDVIIGNMTQTAPTSWFIGGLLQGTTKTSNLNVKRARLITQPWAYCTLEVYNIATCSWFPPPGSAIDFYGMSFTDANGPITAAWNLNSNGSGSHCTTKISSASSANVTISF